MSNLGNVRFSCEHGIAWKDIRAFADRIRREGGSWLEGSLEGGVSTVKLNREAGAREKDPWRVPASDELWGEEGGTRRTEGTSVTN